jgi:hypothetical protein
MQYPPPLQRDHIPIGTSTPQPINKQYEILKKLNVSICFTSIFSFLLRHHIVARKRLHCLDHVPSACSRAYILANSVKSEFFSMIAPKLI